MNKSGSLTSGNTISILEMRLFCSMADRFSLALLIIQRNFGLCQWARSKISFSPLFGLGAMIPAASFLTGEPVMSKKENIVRYTLEELKAMQAAGDSLSNWERAAAMTEEELEAAIASDPDEAGMIVDWSKGTMVLPEPKAVLNMRVDRDILDYFKHQGKGYQSRINAVLRTFVEHQRGR
jgi:uncharacterized protein (DUF4415 family)